MLTVKNGNDFDFNGRYDGRDYNFPKGSTVALPEDAARHIFGIGLENKQDILVRHGWMKNSSESEEAMKKLNGFSFDVTEGFEAGAIVSKPKKEQGTAPLQGEGDSKATYGAEESPNPSNAGRGSMLDSLGAGS